MFSAHDKPTIVNEGLTPPSMPLPPVPEVPQQVPTVPAVHTQTEALPTKSAVVKSSKLPQTIGNYETKDVVKKLAEVLIPAVLILLAMVLVSFLISQYKKPASIVEATPVPTLVEATPAPTPIENPYKDWKAYVNRAAQISFKYPPDVKLNEESTANTKTTITLSHEEDGSVAIGQIIQSTGTDPLALIKTTVSGGVTFDQSTEDDFSISGQAGKSGTYTAIGGGEGIPVYYVYVVHEDSTFLFINRNLSEKELFTKILGTIRFVSKGVTAEWQSYSNKEGSFTLSFPPTWVATESAQTVSIKKSSEDNDYQNLLIQVSTVTGKQSVQLSASELISSLQNLSGWKNTPTLDFRSFGTAQAQIISGVKDGAWQEYGVFWFRNILVQMSWKDTLLRQEQNNFDDILSTLKFK